MTGSMIARGWIVAGSIFVVGLSEREAGLSAAILSITLFTFYFTSQLMTRPFEQERPDHLRRDGRAAARVRRRAEHAQQGPDLPCDLPGGDPAVPGLRQRRRERGVPAAGGVPAHALDRDQDRLADLSINKAVLYLFLTCGDDRGDGLRRQADAAEAEPHAGDRGAYDLTYNQITRNNMDAQAAAKWFPFVATLFFFIWFSNILGYIPLPTNDHETIDIFGFDFPAFALYAATANLSIPLILTLTVFVIYQVEGIRRHGFVRYSKWLLPAGVTGAAAVPIFIIRVISQFVRIISLSIRLFANILAGHLLILFMGGGLAVLLGITALGKITLPLAVAFFIFEVGLVATLRAFIFATLHVYLLRRGKRRRSTRKSMDLAVLLPIAQGAADPTDGLKAIALRWAPDSGRSARASASDTSSAR